VSESLAVIVTLLSNEATDAFFNNLRAAFLAGIAFGLEKNTLIFQEADQTPAPIDYRDFVSTYKHPQDVDKYINELVPQVAEGLQTYSARPLASKGLLARLDLGDPAAENEATRLAEYYLETDEFRRVLAGGVQLVVGRKGSGKTTLFFRVRDILRENKAHVVLDLKPEGHQLKRFKELVLGRLSEAVQEHATAAFWEYVLLLEICYKVLEKDRQRHVNDHTLYEGYRKLEDLYARDELTGGDADFSERMIRLVHRMSDEFSDKLHGDVSNYLTAGEVTQLIFKTEIPELRDELVSYLHKKEGVIVLFDNIDKSWPTHGIETVDILILRGLLNAGRKLGQMFQERGIDF
jgi:energy-coupling factor transporter ATP-binding protein EcfA2